MSHQKLANRVALVTGASKGIGACIAEHLAREGASVVVNYASSQAGADKVVAKIVAAGGKAVAVQADVSKPEQISALLHATIQHFGRLDVLVNNAGIYEVAPLKQITPEHFHRHFNLNVLGPLLLSQQAAELFPEEGGTIVNVSSVVSTLSPAGTTVYNASKSALDGITRSLAKELGPRKIRVNSVNPGLIETEGLHASPLLDAKGSLEQVSPLGRIGQPEDIAPAVLYLACSDSAFMTGETLYVAGGLH